MNKNSFLLSLFILSLVSLSGCSNHQSNISYTEPAISDSTGLFAVSEEEVSFEEKTIYISVQGEVTSPGVYLLPEGSRVYELINKAGGVTDSADTSSINMVYILEDGMQIIIPSIYSEDELYIVSDDLTPSKAGSESEGSSLVNINSASLTELTTLTGIGDTRAKAIIAYRDSGGVFEKPEDLMKVNGIKSGIYEGLKDQICVK